MYLAGGQTSCSQRQVGLVHCRCTWLQNFMYICMQANTEHYPLVLAILLVNE